MTLSAPLPETTLDNLLGGRLSLRQPARGYRVAIDAVFLAAAIPAQSGERALELGCGIGTAALALALRVPGLEILGLDIDESDLALAEENARRNALEGRIRFRRGDVADLAALHALRPFDHVLANPPYHRAEATTPSPHPAKARATVEGAAKLADWLEAGLAALRAGGHFVLIHQARRIEEILAGLGAACDLVRVLPLAPGPERPAKRVIVLARKAHCPGATDIRHFPPFILHEADGRFTAAAEAVLRDLSPLALTEAPTSG